MTPSTPTPLEDQLADIKETLEKEKIKLTPEVEEYIRSHLKVVQDKIADDQDIFEEDLAFIAKVRVWISLSDKLRDKYPTIKDMEGSDEMKIIQDRHLSVSEYRSLFREAEKRQLSLQQWLDLLYMAEAIGEKQEWPAQFFTFEEGRIKTGIGNGLWLRGKNLKLLPDNLYIGGGLDIQNCTSLVSLPNRLSINLDLIIKGCTTLSSLPDDLRAHELILSDDLNPQVIEDALRLHREGKVNHIEYHIL